MMLRRIFGDWEKTPGNDSSKAGKIESDQTSTISVTLTDNASWETASLASAITTGSGNDLKEPKARRLHESPPAARSVGPPSVRLCNHETLPFDRAHRIVNLPSFKNNPSNILDALGAKQVSQHTRSSAAENYVCTNASGTKVECKVKYYEHSIFNSERDGLVLEQEWRKHRLSKKQTCDRSTLQAYFSKENDFAFCPHLRASSNEVVDRAFRLVCPDAGHPDPLEEWLLREENPNLSGDMDLSCSKCKTKLTFYGSPDHITVFVKRKLGECASSEDELWLQQCEQDNA